MPDYKKLYKAERTKNLKLEQIIEIKHDNEKKLKDTVKEQQNDIHNLKIITTDLNKRLQFYDNAHTPPSRKMPEKKKTENKNKDKNKKTTGERGAPKGHKGATNKPKPTKFKQHTPAKCPECAQKILKLSKHRYVTLQRYHHRYNLKQHVIM